MRNDLGYAQTCVQACHASIEAASAFEFNTLNDHPSVIILGVKSEQKLHEIRKYLLGHRLRHACFFEADLDDQLTAVATEPVHGERRQLFRKFQLLKDKTPQPEEEETVYAVKYEDGYYYYAGDCSRSKERTDYLTRAAIYTDKQSAQCWHESAEVIEIRRAYYPKAGKGGAQ